MLTWNTNLVDEIRRGTGRALIGGQHTARKGQVTLGGGKTGDKQLQVTLGGGKRGDKQLRILRAELPHDVNQRDALLELVGHDGCGEG
jgi:hypothetical protein